MEDQQEKTLNTLPGVLGGYAQRRPARFHAPGHKGGAVGGFFRDSATGWDLAPTPAAEEAVQNAERIMSAAYGANASFFVTAGHAAALQTMLLSLGAGTPLLIVRDADAAAYAGCAFLGADPAFLTPPYDAGTQLYGAVTADMLDRRLRETQAGAALVTSPNRYGVCADLAALADVAHAHDALLLVDAARGAHFPFSDALPAAATRCADLAVCDESETLAAVTQAASVHRNDCRVRPEAVRRARAMLRPAGMSYPTAASLDWAVFLAPRQDWTAHVARMTALRAALARINGLAPYPLLPSTLPDADDVLYDGTRLVLDVTARGLDGFTAAAALRDSGVYVAFADARRIVLVTTPEDDPAWEGRLTEALVRLPYVVPRTGTPVAAPCASAPAPRGEKGMPLPRAMTGPAAFVPLESAPGRIAADAAGVWADGVALVAPGERWTAEAMAYLMDRESAGARLFGVDGGCTAVAEEA